MRKHMVRTLGVAGALCLTLTSAQVGSASTVDGLQREMDKVLASTAGGVQISRNEIAWGEGEAILSFPLPGERKAPPSSPAAQRLQAKVADLPAGTKENASALAEDDSSCPTEVFGNDWYCFYQYKDYGGRRLQWNGPHTKTVYFSAYTFNDMASSWSNKGGFTIRVNGRTRAGDDSSCSSLQWTELAHSRSPSVTLDNMADCFTAT